MEKDLNPLSFFQSFPSLSFRLFPSDQTTNIDRVSPPPLKHSFSTQFYWAEEAGSVCLGALDMLHGWLQGYSGLSECSFSEETPVSTLNVIQPWISTL